MNYEWRVFMKRGPKSPMTRYFATREAANEFLYLLAGFIIELPETYGDVTSAEVQFWPIHVYYN